MTKGLIRIFKSMDGKTLSTILYILIYQEKKQLKRKKELCLQYRSYMPEYGYNSLYDTGITKKPKKKNKKCKKSIHLQAFKIKVASNQGNAFSLRCKALQVFHSNLFSTTEMNHMKL